MNSSSFRVIFVHYQAVADIILGIWSLLHAMDIYLLSHQEDRFSLLYYCFIAGAIFGIFKGALLLHGIRYYKSGVILSYFILTSLILVTAKCFIIRLSIERYEEIQLSEETEDLDLKPLLRAFVFDFIIFYPLFFIYNWFMQFFVYLFYQRIVVDSLLEKKMHQNHVSDTEIGDNIANSIKTIKI